MLAARWNAAPVRRWSWQRLVVALGASLLAHYLVVGGWPVSGGGRPAAGETPQMHAQLEIQAQPWAAPVPDIVDPPPEPEPAKTPRPVSAAATRAERQMPPPLTEAKLPANSGANVPDPRFFAARELDRYPVPLAPLDLRGMGSRTELVRAWVSIDFVGSVVDVTVLDADPSGSLQQQVRERLLTARFMPGMKDERPVRSRVLLELVYGQ
jgi:hypothetical protein